MSKISELSDGGSIQSGDTLIAVRSGGNVKVTYGGTTTANIDGGTIDGTVIGGSSAAAGSFTTISASGEIAANGGIALGDNDAATFGASDDLQIYHDGSNSYISDLNTGDLVLQSNGTRIGLASAFPFEWMLEANTNGSVTAYYDGSVKLATTSTGIDVTGTVTADGLTVEGTSVMSRFRTGSATDGRIEFAYNTTDIGYINMQSASVFDIRARSGVDLSLGAGGSERMRIDSSGNVGIGTTSPSQLLSLYANDTTDTQLIIEQDSTGDAGIQFSLTGVKNWVMGVDNSDGDKFKIENGNAIGASNDFVIDSSGNVGIGTTSPATPLHVKTNTTTNVGFFDYVGAATICGITDIGGSAELRVAGQVVSFTGAGGAGTEHMRIDASGNLLVGDTTANIANEMAYILNDGRVGIGAASTTPLIVNRKTNDGSIIELRKDQVIVGSISVTSSTTTYNITSDQRLKENITDAPAGNVDDIKVRSFDWKADGSHQDYGMVAQELEAVAPYAVTKGETEDDMWSVDYSKLVPMLIKEIQSLRARVAQLETN